jgi:penicillin G amidase
MTDPRERRSPPARMGRRWLRRLGIAVGALVALVVLAAVVGALWVRHQLRASLPQLTGERVVSGLAGPVTIERDSLGVPTIRGSSRRDVAFASGFVHAQDRYFQMDLQRRSAAGELAEIFGAGVKDVDRRQRIHRWRTQVHAMIARLPPEQRTLLAAYADGVNAGLAALRGKPFEYHLLGVQPAPWRPEDSLLVLLSMFFLLQDDKGQHESAVSLMQDRLRPDLFAFLTPAGTEWDAPLDGGALGPPAIPSPQVFDSRRIPPRALEAVPDARRPPAAASNAWAVAGTRTADGRALVACDMHLPLGVPNVWYRASLVWPQRGPGAPWRRITGLMLPGLPLLAVGSNGQIAWGFTSGRVDVSDVVLLTVPPGDGDSYLAPDGPRRFAHFTETVRIKGAPAERVPVAWTIWGPEIDKDYGGRRRAVSWVAYHQDAVDLGLVGLETADGVEEALAVAQASGIPTLNFVVGDAAGHIGWTIAGKIPRRVGFDGRTPASWSDGTRRWDGWLTAQEVPRIVDPPGGLVWSANNRAVGGAAMAKLGDGNYILGARARQIRDDLAALARARPVDMLRIQVDNRAVFLARWRRLLLDVLSPAAVAGHPQRREARALVADWGGRAAISSVGYRLVREFRQTVARQVFTAALLPCRQARPDFDYVGSFDQWEGPLWTLLTRRPANFLDPRFRGWDEQLLAAADEVLAQAAREKVPLAQWTWGRHNVAAIEHPMGGAIPIVGGWLNMPREELPGDDNMPLVQEPDYGASERMAVTPGAEGAGLLHMPGGQSGNPISPHYRDAHSAWARGEPTPFLPGPAVAQLRLLPTSTTGGKPR